MKNMQPLLLFFPDENEKLSINEALEVLIVVRTFTSTSVCKCIFPSTTKASPDWNKTNALPEIRPAMLCWGNYCVKYLHRHFIDNHSRDLQASNCARVTIKPGRATRSKKNFLKTNGKSAKHSYFPPH